MGEDPEVMHSVGVALAHKGIDLLAYEKEQVWVWEKSPRRQGELADRRVRSGASCEGVDGRPMAVSSRTALGVVWLGADRGRGGKRRVEALRRRQLAYAMLRHGTAGCLLSFAPVRLHEDRSFLTVSSHCTEHPFLADSWTSPVAVFGAITLE